MTEPEPERASVLPLDPTPRRVLVTGAGSGIGRATAEVLAAAGHHVVATARQAEVLDDLDVAQRLALDVTSDESVAACVAAAGPIDVLVNNAGITETGPLETYPHDVLQKMFDTNVFGPMRMVRALVPAMRERGRGVVVNVTSVEGKVAAPLAGAYCGTKHALEALSESLAFEVGHFGVRVVIVEPGYIAPGMRNAVRHGEDGSPYEELRRQWSGSDETMVGPEGRPAPTLVGEAIAAAIVDPKHAAAGAGGGRCRDGAGRPPGARRRRVRRRHAEPPRPHLVILARPRKDSGRGGQEGAMHGSVEPDVDDGEEPAAAEPEAEAAFAVLYQRSVDDVWRFARRRTTNAAEADDLTAEVFATAWRRRLDLPPADEVRLWLFGTARRVLANHHRSARRRERLHLRLAAQPAAAPPDEARDDVVLWAALASLSPDDRDLLVLRAWDELAVADIAVLLGCTPNAASLRLHKARTRLAAALGTDPRSSRTSPGRSPRPEGGDR